VGKSPKSSHPLHTSSKSTSLIDSLINRTRLLKSDPDKRKIPTKPVKEPAKPGKLKTTPKKTEKSSEAPQRKQTSLGTHDLSMMCATSLQVISLF